VYEAEDFVEFFQCSITLWPKWKKLASQCSDDQPALPSLLW